MLRGTRDKTSVWQILCKGIASLTDTVGIAFARRVMWTWGNCRLGGTGFLVFRTPNETSSMNNRIFPSSGNSSMPIRGQLLIATEMLNGTVFDRTVVLLVQDDENGAFGVILNRPADEKQKQHWRQMSGSPDHVASQLVHGGPMGGPVFAIHKFQSLAEMEMPGELFISAKAEMIQQLFDRNPDNYRIYLGIAGWKDDQLVDEIDRGLWYVMDSDPEDIFDDSDWLWEKALFRYGELALCDVLGITEYDLPLDPSLN